MTISHLASQSVFITVNTTGEIIVSVFIPDIDDLMRLGCARQFPETFDLMIILRKFMVTCWSRLHLYVCTRVLRSLLLMERCLLQFL